MKAEFRGGPWDGCEVDLPVLLEWITLGRIGWYDQPSTSDTMVLAGPMVCAKYVLHREGGLYYELIRINGE